MGAYRLGGHQHVMEVEHLLGRLAGEEVRVTFTAQVVPACRGILSCLYGTLRDGVSAAAVREAYEAFYAGERFVRVSFSPGLDVVRGACDRIAAWSRTG